MVLDYKLPQFDEIGAVKSPCAFAPVDKGIHQFDIVEFQPLVGIEFLSFDGTVILSGLLSPKLRAMLRMSYISIITGNALSLLKSHIMKRHRSIYTIISRKYVLRRGYPKKNPASGSR